MFNSDCRGDWFGECNYEYSLPHFPFPLQLLSSFFVDRDNLVTFCPIRCPFVRDVALPPPPFCSFCLHQCFLVQNWQNALLKEQDSKNIKTQVQGGPGDMSGQGMRWQSWKAEVKADKLTGR